MNNHDNGHASRVLLLALTLALVLAGGWLAASSAYAGSWMEVSCVNPSQSAAPSEGWTSFAGGGGYGSNNSTGCGPGQPDVRDPQHGRCRWCRLERDAAVHAARGSTLVGGSVDVSLRRRSRL